MQASVDDRLNAAIAFGTGRETIQQETTAENLAKQANIKKSVNILRETKFFN